MKNRLAIKLMNIGTWSNLPQRVRRPVFDFGFKLRYGHKPKR